MEFTCSENLYHLPNKILPQTNNNKKITNTFKNSYEKNIEFPLGMNLPKVQGSLGSVLAINKCYLYRNIGNKIFNFIRELCIV